MRTKRLTQTKMSSGRAAFRNLKSRDVNPIARRIFRSLFWNIEDARIGLNSPSV